MRIFGTSQEVLEVKKKMPPSMQETYGFNPWVRKIPWRRAWQPTLPGESHGLRSLVGYCP